MRKGEIACNKQFHLFSQCFLPYMALIMPPFNEVGVYCFAQVGRSVRPSIGRSVGRYTKPCPDDSLTQSRARITKFGRYLSWGVDGPY